MSDDEGLRRVSEVLEQLGTYSVIADLIHNIKKKMEKILKRMDSIYDRV